MTSSERARTTELAGCCHHFHHVALTPLVPVQLAPGEPVVCCKLEPLNPRDSTRDRLARFVREKVRRQGAASRRIVATVFPDRMGLVCSTELFAPLV